MLSKFKDKKVLIFGLGLNQGGVGSAKFFARSGAKVRVTDLKSSDTLKPSIDQLKEFPNIEYSLGGHKNDDIDWANVIIKNPAIKEDNPYIAYAKEKGKVIESDFSIFLEFVNQKKIITVTGTKGKSTTSSLIYEAVKASGKEVVFAGNIGKSILDLIPYLEKDPWIIVEISSFQLQALKDKRFAPYITVITNIYPDHLNYHTNMYSYIETKRLITQFQTPEDFLFLNKDDPILNNPKFTGGLSANIIFYSRDDLPKDFEPMLAGEHNLSNCAAALAVVQRFSVTKDGALKIMQIFKGIEFRLQFIKNWKGFKIYNDSTATNPSATIEALKTLGKNIILICGGMNKNMDYTKLSEAIDERCKALYFLEGDVVDEIICNMKDQTIIEGRFYNLDKLLLTLKQNLESNSYFKKGDIILFSPAATSFNLFQNEFDRGRKFNKAIEKVFQQG